LNTHLEQQMATIVKLVSKTTVSPGEQFNIDLIIEPVAGVAGAQATFSFNPEAIQVDSVEEGMFLKKGGSTFFMPGTINNVLGTVKPIVSVLTVPGVEVTAPGIFATIHCTALQAGKAVNLSLFDVIVGSKEAVALPLESFVIPEVVVAFAWDVNLDTLVDDNDLAVIMVSFGESGTPGWKREDCNNDGAINVLDLILVGQHFEV